MKKIALVLHPLSKFFSFGVPKGEKLPLGHQMEKTSFGGPKEIKTSFFKPLEELFFLLVPQRKFFSLWYPEGKKIAHGGEDRGKYSYFFGQFFSTC